MNTLRNTLLISVLSGGLTAVAISAEPIDIGGRLEPMVDEFLIERLDGAALQMQKPEPQDVVITCDDPWEGNVSAYCTIFPDTDAHSRQVYLTSDDQGRTWSKPRLIIHRGEEYSPEHVLPGIYFGKNACQMANCMVSRSDGAVIVPMQLSILKDGKLFLPPGAFTYLDAVLVIGRWQDDGSLIWEMGQRLSLPPEKSLRGAFEPTVAEFSGGRMLVVLRANDGHKWHAMSRDGGMTWSELKHWTYADGTPFHSPSSISILFRHTSGVCYWIGNICDTQPSGNAPRYPLVIGRVDPTTLLLDRQSMATIDTRRDGDPPGLQLSNFNLVEDRRNGDLLLRMTRWNGAGSGTGRKVEASVNLYRIGV